MSIPINLKPTMFSIKVTINSEVSDNQEISSSNVRLLHALMDISEKLVERFGEEGNLERNFFFTENSAELFSWAREWLNGEKHPSSSKEYSMDLSDPFEPFEYAKMTVTYRDTGYNPKAGE